MTANDASATYARLLRLAAPFAEAGLVDETDLRIVAGLARLGGEAREEVLLALALVVAAPRRGDVALDLARVPGGFGSAEKARALFDATCASPLVSMPGAGPATPFVVHEGLLYTRRGFAQQERLAAALLARAGAGLAGLAGAPLDLAALGEKVRRLFPGSGTDEPDRQALAVATGALRHVSVITGGPGTGKTFTIRALLGVLVELAEERGTALRVALCAPTGKAAARITEAIREGLDAMPLRESTRASLGALGARTLHRLLGVDAGGAGPSRRSRRPLPYDLVIVDEASMVDLTMMWRLVSVLHPEARLVLLGDRHQLASVEAGAVLADLVPPASIAAGLPSSPSFAAALETVLGARVRASDSVPALAECVVHLERPRRFDAGGPVGQVALAIAEGSRDSIERAIDALDPKGGEPDPRASLVPHGRAGRVAEETIRRLASGYRPFLERLERGPGPGERLEVFHAGVLAAFDAYRVLCVHRAGPFGSEAVARAIGASLLRSRERGAREVDGPWLGKPILVVRNSYDTGLFNGDVGVVVSRGGELVVAFAGAGGSVRYLKPERLPPHELALAMTVHKAQGSQVDHVALVLPDAPSAILGREIVYTGVTRARSRVTVIGDRALLRTALEQPTVRASGLAGMLWGTTRDPGPVR